MESILSFVGLVAIFKIIVIDILLAGDNAVVIGMAAKNLEEDLRKKAIFFGTMGAIVLRLVMSFAFVEALQVIPALHLIGGLLLLWIGHSLLVPSSQEHHVEAKNTLRAAVMVIVIADGIMSIDNVLGVVGAANGHMGLVVGGLLLTVPLIIWGSTLFVKVIDRYPAILYFGGGLLGWVGASMIIADDYVHDILEPYSLWVHLLGIIIVLASAYVRKQWRKK